MKSKFLSGVLLVGALFVGGSVWGSDYIFDSFWEDPTSVDIGAVFQSENKVKVLVTGTNDIESRTVLLDAFLAPRGWKNYDEQLYSKERVKVQVLIGSRIEIAHEDFEMEMLYIYTPGVTLEGFDENSENAEWATWCKFTEYTRPDDSIFKKLEEELYQLKKEIVEEDAGTKRVCTSEWDIFSQWKVKTRHQIATKRLTNIMEKTYKRSLNPHIDEKPTLEGSNLIKTKQVQISSGEEPNCA